MAWITLGIAKPTQPRHIIGSRATRQWDEHDQQAQNEARATRTIRNITPTRQKRYEDKDGEDIVRDLLKQYS